MSQDATPAKGAEHPLNEVDVLDDPIAQFRRWFDQAQAADLLEPAAMTLATATADGRPSARVVLLRDVDRDGFVFFTNYDSRKGREIESNPHGALVMWWPPLARQVRIEGTLERVRAEVSDAYHRSRDRGKQLAAWVSAQSQVVTRETLTRDYEALQTRHQGTDIPRPPFWGGFRLRPALVEFWQGRQNRLHDRLCYRLDESGAWILERLAP